MNLRTLLVAILISLVVTGALYEMTDDSQHRDLNALARGYVLFKVNDKLFLSYRNAEWDSLSLRFEKCNVSFTGYHLWRGWEGFFYKICAITPTEAQTPNEISI